MNEERKKYLKENKERIIKHVNYKAKIDDYNRQIHGLFNVDGYELLGEEESYEITGKIIGLVEAMSYESYKIPFQDKRPALCKLVEQFPDQRIFLNIEASKYCGVAVLPNLSCLNVDFPFDVEPWGWIEVFTEDFQFGFLLDFYERFGQELLGVKFSPNLKPISS